MKVAFEGMEVIDLWALHCALDEFELKASKHRSKQIADELLFYIALLRKSANKGNASIVLDAIQLGGKLQKARISGPKFGTREKMMRIHSLRSAKPRMKWLVILNLYGKELGFTNVDNLKTSYSRQKQRHPEWFN